MSRRAGRTAREAAERRARRRQLLGMAAAAVAVLVIGAAALALLGGGSRGLHTEAAPVEDYPYPVQMFPPDPGSSIVDPPGPTPILPRGRRHIAVGERYDDYNSNPPTSGPHTAPVAPGVYDEPVAKEALVHNMEHGQVVVWYNCDGGPAPLTVEDCRRLRDDLAAVVNDALDRGKQVVMTPYPNMDQRIALTAWQFLDAFDDFGAQRVRTFIDTFYCHTNLEGFC
jgi:Protein of unknown function (DUF3105)